MKHVALGGLVSLAFACSSAPLPDPGIKGPTVTTNCSADQMNPYQVCYPTQNLGTSARTATTAGSTINNYAFTGYNTPNLTVIDPTMAQSTTVHLADYYDPMQKGLPNVINGLPIKLIHLSVAALWCGPCNDEADFVAGSNFTGTNTAIPPASFASELAPLGVVFVSAIDDGPVVGTGATIADLNTWINRHHDDFTTMLDPGNQNLGVFFDAAAIPFNANIDARTMEILSTDVGFDEQLDQTIKTTYLPLVTCLAACMAGDTACQSACK
jgi:hypothetical protein